jgi:hypothetical protein
MAPQVRLRDVKKEVLIDICNFLQSRQCFLSVSGPALLPAQGRLVSPDSVDARVLARHWSAVPRVLDPAAFEARPTPASRASLLRGNLWTCLFVLVRGNEGEGV